MLTHADVREIALSLPEAHEAPHFESTAFRVGTKIFCTAGENGAGLILKLLPEEQHNLSQGDQEPIQPVAGYWGRSGWTEVAFADMARDPLARSRADGLGRCRAQASPALMPTADDVRRLAYPALPEAYEDTHRRKPAFRVAGRIFAMLGVERPDASPGFFAPLSGARPVTSLTIHREDQLQLRRGVPGTPSCAADPHGFSYVWLDTVGDDTLALLIRMSWAKAAPKRLSKQS